MGHTLLTGATGLLGRYLLRDLLLRGVRVAVVVRPGRHETPEQRVDHLLAHWENEWGRNLPRPVVFAGDVTQPLLGLEPADRAWLRRHCDTVLHSAASLTFYEKRGEPWQTNVEGVRNVLQLCRDAGVRVLEHLSTAYVCGLRTDRALESELEVGQEYGNDYERSKVAAEKLVRSDDHLDTFTIFRPSIIVGDSQTGYTPTFHGFYSPLRVAAALLSAVALEEALEVDYLRLLGLKGHERKNFIPVDWVSDAIVSIRERTSPHGATYALASEHPVAVQRMRRVFEDTVKRHQADVLAVRRARQPDGSSMDSAGGQTGNTDAFERLYVEHFAVYRSYWRDDPDFDCSNTRAVLPDLPPPEVTDEMLTMLCEYALAANFGFPPPRYEPPAFSPRDWIRARGSVYSNGAVPASPRMGITVTGPGGGSWTVYDGDRGGFRYCEGGDDVASEMRMSSAAFRELVQAETDLDAAIERGQVVVFGSPSGIQGLRQLLRADCGATAGRN